MNLCAFKMEKSPCNGRGISLSLKTCKARIRLREIAEQSEIRRILESMDTRNKTMEPTMRIAMIMILLVAILLVLFFTQKSTRQGSFFGRVCSS